MNAGKLYGVGVGTGSGNLLTLKAVGVLNKADIVFAPKSSLEKSSTASFIVKKAIKKKFNIVEPVFPMTRKREALEKAWGEAGEAIAKELCKGKNVAFITIGDPMLYSTFFHVLRKVKKILPDCGVEVVPGISSISSCMAESRIGILEDQSLAVLPASSSPEKILEAAENFDVVIIMKVPKEIEKISSKLKKLKNKKAMILTRCGTGEFRMHVIEDIENAKNLKLSYFSMVILYSRGQLFS